MHLVEFLSSLTPLRSSLVLLASSESNETMRLQEKYPPYSIVAGYPCLLTPKNMTRGAIQELQQLLFAILATTTRFLPVVFEQDSWPGSPGSTSRDGGPGRPKAGDWSSLCFGRAGGALMTEAPLHQT